MNTESKNDHSEYCEKFFVPSHLVGLALGKQSSYINKIRQLDGITKALFRDQNFEVCGVDKDVVKIARSLLEYNDKEFVFPRFLIETLLANDGGLMNHIIFQSGLVRIEVVDEINEARYQEKNALIRIVLRGTLGSIEKAKSHFEQLKSVLNSPSGIKGKKSECDYRHCEKFRISKSLVGLSLGKNGHNVEMLKKNYNLFINTKNVDGRFMEFTVCGNNLSDVKHARTVLELVDDCSLKVPKNKAGVIIGKGGSKINEIAAKSGVLKINISDERNISTVHVVGNPEKVEVAKTCIEALIRE